MDLSNHRVRFRIRDVHFPDIAELLLELHGGDMLEGKVTELTESAEHGGTHFAVVEVDGAERITIIVPLDRLLRLP